MEKEIWQLTVKGRVQGVNYRRSVRNFVHENHLDLAGHVKNLSDGSVLVVAQGELNTLEQLLSFCSKGLPPAHVIEVNKTLLNNQTVEKLKRPFEIIF